MRRGWSGPAIAAIYIGALIGAGFASGQEVLQFFARYGAAGLLGAACSGLGLALLGALILLIGQRSGQRDYELIAMPDLQAPRLLVRWLVTLLSLGMFLVMIAGAGEWAAARLHAPRLAGAALLALLVWLVASRGSRAILSGFAILVPLMLVIMLLVFGLSLARRGLVLPPPISGQKPGWLLSALLFVAYNSAAALALLAPLGATARSRGAIGLGMALSGLVMSFFALMICLTLAAWPQAAAAPLPLAAVATLLSPPLGWLYDLTLLSGIFTTALAMAFALLERWGRRCGQRQALGLGLLCLLALACAPLGFARLISIIYPLSGYASLLLIVGLLYNYISLKRR